MSVVIPKSLVDDVLTAVFATAKSYLPSALGDEVDMLHQIVQANEPAILNALAAAGVQFGVFGAGTTIAIPKAVFDLVVAAVFTALTSATTGRPFLGLAIGWVQSAVTSNETALISSLAAVGIVVQ